MNSKKAKSFVLESFGAKILVCSKVEWSVVAHPTPSWAMCIVLENLSKLVLVRTSLYTDGTTEREYVQYEDLPTNEGMGI